MARLMDCPDELLLHIASHLPPSDNQCLSMTARRLRGPAQEILPRNIKLTESSKYLPMALRTLAHRPDLMNKVRSIEMAEYIERTLGSDDWDEVFECVSPISQSWDRYSKLPWMYRVAMQNEHACMGVLLCLAPKLEHLSIVHDCTRWPCGPINFSTMSLPVVNSPTEPHWMLLPELTTLSIPMIHLDKAWFFLPQLRHLDIDCTRNISKLTPDAPTQKIESLMLRCTTKLTDHLGYLDPLSSLLAQFPNVKKLVVNFTDQGVDAVWDEEPPSSNRFNVWRLEQMRLLPEPGETFAYFTNELVTIAAQLESLELVCPDTGDVHDLGYRHPLQTLQQFTQLKHLCIPQGAFTHTTDVEVGVLGMTAPSPLFVLPPTLEYLCVSHPTPAIVEWLGGILDDRDWLPNLTLVELDFGEVPPDDLSEYEDDICRIVTALFNAGVVIRVKE